MRTAKVTAALLTFAMVIASVPLTSRADEVHKHDDNEYQAWTSAESLPSSGGNYYLTGDVEISSTWEVPVDNNTYLCLNGHDIRYTGDDDAPVIRNTHGKSLYIEDCEETLAAGKITGGKDYGIKFEGDGSLYLRGGEVSGNIVGGIYASQGSINIEGGSVSDNLGSGVVLEDHSGFIMTRGLISRNMNPEGNGGGIRISPSNCICYISGGEISGNTALYGGGIYCDNGLYALAHVSIKDNNANLNGGGLYVTGEDSSGALMHDTLITGNSAGRNGGGLYLNNCRTDGCILYDADISGNNAAVTGGGILYNDGCLVLNSSSRDDKVLVSDNEAGGKEDNLYLRSGKTLKISSSFSSSDIGISMSVPGVFTDGFNNLDDKYLPSAFFTSDADDLVVGFVDDEAGLVSGEQYKISLDPDIANGKVTCDRRKAAPGDTVTLTFTPDTYYELSSVSVTCANGDEVSVYGDSFVMPDSDVWVTAEFSKDEFVDPEDITLDKAEITLLENETYKFNATVLPDYATDKSVVWSSSDPSVATVDNEGNVTAVKAGAATITVSAVYGEASALCEVTVNEHRYNVVFEDGFGNILKEENVKPGEDAEAPDIPGRDRYFFTGWDKDFTSVNEDLTVKATWGDVMSDIGRPITASESPVHFSIDPSDGFAVPGQPVTVTTALYGNDGKSGYRTTGFEYSFVYSGKTYTFPLNKISDVKYRFYMPETDGEQAVLLTAKYITTNRMDYSSDLSLTVKTEQGEDVAAGSPDVFWTLKGDIVTVNLKDSFVLNDGQFAYYVVTKSDGTIYKKQKISGREDWTFTAPDHDTQVSVMVRNKLGYIDADGTPLTCNDYLIVNVFADRELGSGWYVVTENLTVNDLKIKGNVNLILCDGAKLTVNGGIELLRGNTLTVWCQNGKTGTIETRGGQNQAGIGGNYYYLGGKLVINGGKIYAYGGQYAAGIGSGRAYYSNNSCSSSIEYIQNNGYVEAYGSYVEDQGSGAGIGGAMSSKSIMTTGFYTAGGTVTVNGGTLKAVAYGCAAGIGGSGNKDFGASFTMNGGDVTAVGGEYGGAGISNGTTVINSGVLHASGRGGGAGIGGSNGTTGYSGSPAAGKVTISGGEVFAYAEGGFGTCGAIGRGANALSGDSTRSLTIASDMCAKTGSDQASAFLALSAERYDSCSGDLYAYVYKCSHSKEIYEIDETNHTRTCKYCDVSDNAEAHILNDENICTVCGAHPCTIKFIANGGTGTMADVVVLEGSSYTFPGNSFGEPEGQAFKGWKYNNAVLPLPAGTEITVSADITLTAQWQTLTWNSLQTWINNAADGSAIKLSADLTAESSDKQLTIPEGKVITIDLNGHTLNRNLTSKKDTGSVFYVKSGANFTLKNGTIKGGYSENGGGINMDYDPKTRVALIDVDVTNNQAESNGGAICNRGNVSVKGGSLTNNKAGKYGGAICNPDTDQSVQLNTSGVEIKNNAAKVGGGIYAGKYTALINTVITNNKCSGEEFTYRFNNGLTREVYLEGGGVFVQGGVPFGVGGSTIIKDNICTRNNKSNNLYLRNKDRSVSENTNVVVNFSTALNPDAEIGITYELKEGDMYFNFPAQISRPIEDSYGNVYASMDNFFADDPVNFVLANINVHGYIILGPIDAAYTLARGEGGGGDTIYPSTKDAVIVLPEDLTPPATAITPPEGKELIAWESDGTTYYPGQWVELNGPKTFTAIFGTYWSKLQDEIDAASDGAVIKLGRDYKALSSDRPLNVSGKNITIDLNGHTLDRADTGSPALIVGGETAGLTLRDSKSGNKGKITGGSVGVLIKSGSSLTMESGNIKGNAEYGIKTETASSTLNLKGTPIVTDNVEGNIFLAEGAVINISGAITKNARAGVTLAKGPGTELKSVEVTSGFKSYTYREFITDDSNNYLVKKVGGETIFTLPMPVYKVTGKTSLVYTGEPQELVTAEITGGTIAYSLEKNATEYSDTISATNAKTYFVYYKITGDKDHCDYISEQPVSVTIRRATPDLGDVTANKVVGTTDITAVTLSHSKETVPGTLALSEDVTELKLGTYSYAWRFTPSDPLNYEVLTGTVDITVEDYIWGTPVYSWSGDKSKVKATVYATNDPTVFQEEEVDTVTTDTPATCENAGQTVVTATFTNDKFSKQEEVLSSTPALGHDWSEWTVTTPASTGSEGVMTRECIRCHKTETKAVAKLTPTPTETPAATATPTATATPKPTTVPSATPTKAVSLQLTPVPTNAATVTPAGKPSVTPKSDPTASPTGSVKPSEKPTAEPTKAATVTLKLDKTKAELVCGKTLTLKATLTGSKDKLTWKSSDTKVATVDVNGKVTVKMAGQATITASAAGKTATCVVTVLYKDVTNTKDFWYAPTNYLTAKGVVKGYANQTEFRPANVCTRAQMVTFIWRLQGEPKPKAITCKFKDVKKTDYFYKACIWGNENHIVEGYKDGTFGPQIVCARKHAVTFLWRLANKPKPVSSKNKFKDVKKSDYFYTATLWASEKGILAGYSDGTFKPDGDCLRRQMVTFLYKYDKFVNGKG